VGRCCGLPGHDGNEALGGGPRGPCPSCGLSARSKHGLSSEFRRRVTMGSGSGGIAIIYDIKKGQCCLALLVIYCIDVK
jgi:hypothetical protein